MRLKHAGGRSSIFYRNEQMKVVGWKGDLFCVQAQCPEHTADHVGPDPRPTVVSGDFRGAGLVVLSIVPQIAVADLEAEELPSYHRNINPDEVMQSHADEDPSGRRPGSLRHAP